VDGGPCGDAGHRGPVRGEDGATVGPRGRPGRAEAVRRRRGAVDGEHVPTGGQLRLDVRWRRLHRRGRLRRRRPQPADRGDLRQPRGAGPRLRAGDAAHGRARRGRRRSQSEAVRPVRALRVDRRAHPPAGRRARRVRRGDREPDRREDRPDHLTRARRRVCRATRPAQRAWTAHAGQPDGQRQGARRAAAHHREGAGFRSSGPART